MSMEPTPLVLFTPLAAATYERDEATDTRIRERMRVQPVPVRLFMTSLDTAKAIRSLVDRGIIPETHGVAAARLVAFIALGDVQQEQTAALLEKIGVPNAPTAAGTLASEVLTLLEAAREKARKYPGLSAPEPVPPLAVRRPMVGPPPRPPAIIDLRKQQP